MTFDLKVVNGTVVDGTGLSRRRADVAVEGGRIVEVGNVRGAAERTIDAEGRIVAPGIVDLHTHYDPQLSFDPWATSSCYHGVTTVVAGNCGYSIAPCRAVDREYLAGLFAVVEGIDPHALDAVSWDFETFPELLESRRGKLGVNFACYVGHTSVRRFVMGAEATQRAATDHEIAAMATIVHEAIEAGAAGFSSSRGSTQFDAGGHPVPSRVSTDAELMALVSAAGRSGRGSVTYLPEGSLGGALGEADRELLIAMGLACRLPVLIQGIGGRSKVDAPTVEGWGDTLRFFEDATTRGAAIYSLLRAQPFDRSFSLSSDTPLFAGVPAWDEFLHLSNDRKLAVLSQPESRQALELAEANTDPMRGSTLQAPPWSSLRIVGLPEGANRHFVGRTLDDIAQELGSSPAAALLQIALEEQLQVELRYLSERADWFDAVAQAQRHPNILLGISDGGAHLDRDDSSEWSSYFLRTWVLDRELWSLEDGIRQITHVPAALLGIPDRGLVLPGFAGDLFVFDPDVIAPDRKVRVWDLPGGFARYSSRPRGVDYTIVNGKVVVEQGELTGELPGQVLRPGVRAGSISRKS